MKTIEQYISPLIESHFPQLYKEQGPLLILFVKEYYKWLEENDSQYANYANTIADGNPNYHIRKFLQYKDIDTTVESFIDQLKEKYLKGVDPDTTISKIRLIKAAKDLYRSKGSERSLDLFFKTVYGTNIQVYVPGEDVLKPSSGKWVLPTYLELTRSARTPSFVGKQITGTRSGARAFIEYVITRNVKGKLTDVAFLSNISGNFIKDELITENGIFDGAPKITGSLNSLNIITGGTGFTIGEEVQLISSRGIEGVARVTQVQSASGILVFTIIDGGYGYTLSTNSIIAETMLKVSNVVNANVVITGFSKYEQLTQNLFSFSLTDVTGTLSGSAEYTTGDTSSPPKSVSVSVTQATESNTANIVLNQVSSNVFSNNILIEKNRAIIVTNTNVEFVSGTPLIQYDSGAGSNSTLGIVSSISNVVVLTTNTSSIGSNGIHVGTYIQQATSNATGIVTYVNRESNFAFTNVTHIAVTASNGTFTNTDTITIYPDSANATSLGTFDPEQAQNGYAYLLTSTNKVTNTRWSSGNTALVVDLPTTNNLIILSSDIGGLITANVDVTATGNVIASNSTHIGLIGVTNTFYSTNGAIAVGASSNTYANIDIRYSGTLGDFNVLQISSEEGVSLNTDFLNGENVSNAFFESIYLNGIGSNLTYLSGVYIIESGTSYDNTDIVVFTGGNTGAGSFESANASITTDASGNIVIVTLTANTGNNILSTPTVSITNSTGGSTSGSGANLLPLLPYGFAKFTNNDLESVILSSLSYTTANIGIIAQIGTTNPGIDYSTDPFVIVVEKNVVGHGVRDSLIEISNIAGPGFTNGEFIVQTNNVASNNITSNTFSGNSTSYYEVNELVYSTDGISNVATGIVYSSNYDAVANIIQTTVTQTTGSFQNTIAVSVLTVGSNTNFEPGNFIEQGTANGILVSSNSTTLIVKDVSGTFQANATAVTSNASPTPGSETITSESNTNIFTITGLTSNLVSFVTNTASSNVLLTTNGKIIQNTANSVLKVKRYNLFTEFVDGLNITGISTGTTAKIEKILIDLSSDILGENANISANAVTSDGSISNLQVIASGLGYEDDETITVASQTNSQAVATGKAIVRNQGIEKGYQGDTNGFLSSNKFLQDGDYYQDYSYEIQTNIPFEQYSEVIKKVVHVAGKKVFGRLSTTNQSNLNIITSSSVTTS